MNINKMGNGQKRVVGRYVREELGYESPRFAADGSVSAVADPMPNTNQRGRVFVGWDTELLSLANDAGY